MIILILLYSTHGNPYQMYVHQINGLNFFSGKAISCKEENYEVKASE